MSFPAPVEKIAEASTPGVGAITPFSLSPDALALLDVHAGTEELALHLLRKKAVPSSAFTDAVHIALAALHKVRFIASWNFRHIVGAVARRNIELALTDFGAFVPVIATPEEILESLK